MNAPRNTFRSTQRLQGNGAFKRVIDARARIDGGPISFHAAPRDAFGTGSSTVASTVASTAASTVSNTVSNTVASNVTRMGISIGRRAGNAAVRNRLKRLLREAFRLSQHEHPHSAPAPYDLVVIVRAHEELPLDEYRARLLDALQRLHATWTKRMQRKIHAHAADARATMPSTEPLATDSNASNPNTSDSPPAH